jgi:hypothetical protein
MGGLKPCRVEVSGVALCRFRGLTARLKPCPFKAFLEFFCAPYSISAGR